MKPSRRIGRVAVVFLVAAAIVFVRAHLAYSNGFAPTNLPSFDALIGFFWSESRPAGYYRVIVDEERLTLALAFVSLLSAIASIAFALRARSRGEPAAACAGVAMLSFAVGILALRLIAWMWPGSMTA